MKNLIKNFFSRHYIFFFISQFLGIFNDNFFRIALVTYIMLNNTSFYAQTTRLFIASSLIAVFMLPSLLFSAMAGEIIDKYRKDIVIKLVKLAQFLVAFIVIAFFLLKSIWLLVIVLFVSGILSVLLNNTKFSAVPELLNKDNLVLGNSLIQAGTYIAILLGNVCGILVYSVNKKWLFFIHLAIAVIGLISSFFIPKLKSNTQKINISKNFIKTIYNNMFYFNYSKDIYLCILGISWFWFLGVILVYQIPNFAEIILNGQQSLYIVLTTLLASGAFVGSIFSYFLLKKEISIKYIPISVIFMTIFIVDLSFSANYVHMALTTDILLRDFLSTFLGIRVIIDVFAYSLFAGLYIVPLITVLQVVANRKIRARVFAINNIVNILFMIAGSIICFSFIRMGLSFPVVLSIIALFNIIVAIYICSILPAHLLRIITKKFIELFYKIEIVGQENFDKCKGGTLIVANHTSLIDGLILSVVFGEKLSFAINTDVTKKFWIKPFLKMIKYFPIDNTNVMVVKSIVDEIKKGHIVVIFPEGRITTTGGLMKVYPGPAVIADKSNADILPICIEGIQYSDFSYFGAKIKSKRQRNIKLTILPPRKLNVNQSLSDVKRRNIAITKLYDIMCEMKFASNFSNKPIFESMIDCLSLVSRRKKILDDINRTPITLGRFICKVFTFTNKIIKQTDNKEFVGIIASNTKSTIEIFFALSALNRIPAMINYTDTIENILFNINNVGIKIVYTAKFFIKILKLENLIVALKNNNITVIYIEDIENSFTIFNQIAAFLKSFFPRTYYKNICSKFDKNSPAVILFTSALKGKSKAVILTHRNIQVQMAQLSSVMDFGILDSFFNAIPIFSSLGLIAGTLLPLLRGIKVFLYHSPLHYKMVSELVYDTNSTVLLGTDTFLNGYAKNAHPYNFYAIRYVIAGIEKLKEETIKIWEDNFGKRIFEAYGTTETSSTISINTPMYFKEYSVGKFLPSIECKLESTTVFVGASHLLVKGPNIANWYIEKKQLVSTKVDGLWFDTGDIVEIDDDKFIFIKGKSKRFTKVDGESVSLTELEFNISNIWKDSKHTLLSILVDGKKEIVLFTTNQSATLQQLEKKVQEQKIENFVLPNRIIIVERIPIIGTGATDYVKLHEKFKELK